MGTDYSVFRFRRNGPNFDKPYVFGVNNTIIIGTHGAGGFDNNGAQNLRVKPGNYGQIDGCPADGHSGIDCNFDGKCAYGEQTCCGKTTANTICFCEDGKTQCVISDRCMFPKCETSEPTKQQSSGGWGNPEPPKTPKPTNPPKTPRPTEIKTPRPTVWIAPKTPRPTNGEKTPRPTPDKTPRPTLIKTPRPTKEEKTPRPSVWNPPKTPRPTNGEKTPRPTPDRTP